MRARPFHRNDLTNLGLLEPGKVLERYEELTLIQEQPEPVGTEATYLDPHPARRPP